MGRRWLTSSTVSATSASASATAFSRPLTPTSAARLLCPRGLAPAGQHPGPRQAEKRRFAHSRRGRTAGRRLRRGGGSRGQHCSQQIQAHRCPPARPGARQAAAKAPMQTPSAPPLYAGEAAAATPAPPRPEPLPAHGPERPAPAPPCPPAPTPAALGQGKPLQAGRQHHANRQQRRPLSRRSSSAPARR